jgi:hypothetical protein
LETQFIWVFLVTKQKNSTIATEIKDMTPEELLQLIDKAADEDQTELDLAGLEELPPEIGKCPPLERLVLGNFAMRV